MTAPQMPPRRPREPRPEAVAAIARRQQIRNLEHQAKLIRDRVGPGERLDNVLDQLAPLYRQQKETQ